MYWRSVAGHNHIVHSVLTILALGGGPDELQRAFDDGVDIQRSMPPVDEDVVRSLSDPIEFCARMGQLDQYSNFLAFFVRHTVTAALSVAVLVQQPWIDAKVKARLVEWKAQVDLVWYVSSGAVALHLEDVLYYTPGASAGMDWIALYRAVTTVHDDGHLAKFVRALRNGAEVSRPWENAVGAGEFPIQGKVWLRIGQMAYDTTVDRPIEQKWIWGIGFDENWTMVLPGS